jgi:hypothetical protein
MVVGSSLWSSLWSFIASHRQIQLPTEPLVIYLYNPFNANVMKRVVDRVLASHSAHPRPIYVIYANPFLENLWVDQGFTVLRASVVRPPCGYGGPDLGMSLAQNG